MIGHFGNRAHNTSPVSEVVMNERIKAALDYGAKQIADADAREPPDGDNDGKD
jgi:hypothetical protein